MMARSRAVDRLRERRGVTSAVSCDCVVLAAPELADADSVRRVREVFAILPKDQRQALELAFYEGYTHSEISQLLNEPLGTVKTRIRSAMTRLRTALG